MHYDDHSLRLRGVADADDPKCPDDMAGCLVVSYDVTHRPNDSYTEIRTVSTRLPVECLVLFDGGRVDVADLSATEREWLQAASREHSNEIDFAGTETGEAVSA